MMVSRVAAFRGRVLPFSPVKVGKDANGQRIIEGSKPFVDAHPDIPWGRKIGMVWTAYSKSERDALIAEKTRRAMRAEKKAAKLLAASLPKVPPKIKAEKPVFVKVSPEDVAAKLKAAEEHYGAKFRAKQARREKDPSLAKIVEVSEKHADILPADRASFKSMSDADRQAWAEKCGGRKLTAPVVKNQAA